jgi:HEAT repeat protein
MTNAMPAPLSLEGPDIRGTAASALAAFRPDAISEREFRELLCGNASQRVGAAFVIASRKQPTQLDVFASLAFDRDPNVRATVANCLAYWVAQDVAVDAALALLQRIIAAPGTQVPRMIATGIVGAETTVSVSQLAKLLKEHPSGYVRSISVQHLTQSQTNQST